ncbi:MAG TPA: hypothetical protein VMM12_05545 [Longimicrobiales bacterium]|nr:hypothetical protein [Longimicrobiales bacterium]
MTRRPGMSLTELIVALGIFTLLMVTSLGFYQKQGRAFSSGNERMTLMQNLRYAVNALEQNLRTAGVGVPAKQPVVVYAGEYTFAFNGDYATNIENDVVAVYYDPGLPATAVSSVPPSRAFTIPGTAFLYPDSSYFVGGGTSPAETITFHFGLDSTTTHPGDYVLYRQVNDGARETIARGLVRTDHPFFRYYEVVEDAAGGPVVEVTSPAIPAAHTVPIHGSPADTAQFARIDAIRAVRVTYAATNGLEGARETQREITRLIRLPNAGVAVQQTCGSRPILGVSLAAVGVAPGGGTPGHIDLAWNQATDEHSGEQDVLRYVLWRRVAGATAWGDPLVSLAAGAASYTYQDFAAAAGQPYNYALAAQDCTPQYSSLSETGNVEWNG